MQKYDDSIWDTWWLDSFSTVDRIEKNRKQKRKEDKKYEHTKRVNEKHMGTI